MYSKQCYSHSFATTRMEATTASSSHFGSAEAEQPPAAEREHMFDKDVTPSDVGKLNRLVIPKQYAEKYFPLDPSLAEKGLSLCFEDREGKQWQVRYSYWKSSQSYVVTKGWSRFVKDKKLHAGDTISFYRGTGEAIKGRLFIDWQRRQILHHSPRPQMLSMGSWPVHSMRNNVTISFGNEQEFMHYQNNYGNYFQQKLMGNSARSVDTPVVFESFQAVEDTKQVMLFGVNLKKAAG